MKRLLLLAAVISLMTPCFSSNGQLFGDLMIPVSVSFTATYETDAVSPQNAALLIRTEHSTKITSATILQWAGTALGENLSGYTLEFDDTALEMVAVNRKTQDQVYLDNLISVELPSAWVESGSDNLRNGTYTHSEVGAMSVTFNDGNGNSFALSGLIRESIHSSQTALGLTMNLTCSGAGTLSTGGNAVFSGTIAGSATRIW